MRRLSLVVPLLFLSLLFSFQTVSANCGLQGCPVSSGPSRHPLTVDAALRYAEFDLDGFSGHYTEFLPRIEYSGVARWVMGGYGSLVGLDSGADSHTGLGNPVLYGEYHVVESDAKIIAMGSQLELPLGDDEHGIAAEHAELLPYASLYKPASFGHWFGMVGYRFALAHHDDHESEHMPLLVNPHADREFLYRLGVGGKSVSGFVPQVFLDGQHAMEGEDDGTGFLTAGASVDKALSSDSALAFQLEAPLTSPRRFEWKVATNLRLKI